jgi:hypothetical protein
MPFPFGLITAGPAEKRGAAVDRAAAPGTNATASAAAAINSLTSRRRLAAPSSGRTGSAGESV